MQKTFFWKKNSFAQPLFKTTERKDATSFPLFFFFLLFLSPYVFCVFLRFPILFSLQETRVKKKKELVLQLWAHVFSPSSDLGRWTGLELWWCFKAWKRPIFFILFFFLGIWLLDFGRYGLRSTGIRLGTHFLLHLQAVTIDVPRKQLIVCAPSLAEVHLQVFRKWWLSLYYPYSCRRNVLDSPKCL